MKMKIPFNKLVLASSFAFTVIFLSQCTKSSSSTSSNSNNTITDLAQSSPVTTVFYHALTKTGMDTVLKGSGPFTVFLPTDSAFLASGITSSTIDATANSVVKDLILYHTIAGTAMPRSSFPTGPNAKLIMGNGDSVFVTNDATTGFFVNGIPVRQTDFVASNGYIQALATACLLPPRGSIYETILLDTSFTLLAAAVTRASQGTYNVQAMLSTNGPYTFLAPVDSAFVNAGYSSVSIINGDSPDALANILMYHMIVGRNFTSDILPNKPLNTANSGNFVTFQAGISLQVKGQSNATPANVLNANIMARNGVVFVIDQLLKP
jgi:uncharacterized surface protein with fasciclin (FAS1) repeats